MTTESEPVGLLERYRAVRKFTEHLAAPLQLEDQVIQSMPDVSPTRWHLAHTTWFFEAFVLAKALPYHKPHHPAFESLFSAHYDAAEPQYPQRRRGLLSRPTVGEIVQYRRNVDRMMEDLLGSAAAERIEPHVAAVELGLHHEQQHQEMILTDIKHVLAQNPLRPAYRDETPTDPVAGAPLAWIAHEAGLREIGYAGDGFHFDSEGPCHKHFVEAYEIATRPVTNGDFLAFVEDGGYERPDPWLSEGWASVRRDGIRAPIYWVKQDDGWYEFTLFGLVPLDPARPLCHVSLYEADAYATWAGARLPTEVEWEVAAADAPIDGRFIDSGLPHPAPAVIPVGTVPSGLFGDVWEWTSSAYAAYPGYRAPAEAIGEYNGRFMVNQYVLRGGSCATSRDHVRQTYRHFLPARARWHFTGLRLAR